MAEMQGVKLNGPLHEILKGGLKDEK